MVHSEYQFYSDRMRLNIVLVSSANEKLDIENFITGVSRATWK